MANLKVCGTSNCDYCYAEFYAIFARIVAFVPKCIAQRGHFRQAICPVAAGIGNKTSVQVKISKRNVNIRARLLPCMSGDHAHCSFFRILATTAKSFFISLQPTVAPWLEYGGNTKISCSAGCTIPAQEILETQRQILFSQAVCGSILGLIQGGMCLPMRA